MACGRRSGKTELAKRRGVQVAMCPKRSEGFIAFTAPTYQQAKNIYWNDILALLPAGLIRGRVSRTELQIPLVTGPTIIVTGLDRPERIEGAPLLWVVLDEYGNMDERVWPEHIRPALSDSDGDALFIGAPEGRNHYWELWEAAHERDNWACYNWPSSDILPAAEIAAAKADLDEQTFRQEYEGQFISSTGSVYYTFRRDVNAANRIPYNKENELVFCWDFNVRPGSVVIVQENIQDGYTLCIDELYVKRYTNTEELCNMLLQRYGTHEGEILLCGDPSGGAKHISQISQGTAWEQILEAMRRHFGYNRVHKDVGYEEIRERPRVNALCSRIRSMSGKIRLFIDPTKCPNLIKDLEGVTYKEGKTEIDKSSEWLTHLSEALAFYVARKFPVRSEVVQETAPMLL